MTARFLNRVTGAMSRMASTIKCRASNPRHIIQCREMSEKQDDTYKERCTDDGQFFKGCFKKEPRKKCPEVQERPKKSGCNNSCKDGHCRQTK
ncbi:uncharacterized protein Dvir_GJ25844 [Drosophila virilis]|uniref:Uncharacterized protein n=1 Tax=Drosophila virilis TaxID=7244 RepID=A0A0Q9WVA0_DROVI|nr:uncharacterized protein LOC26530614 [Drosophila virilis]KRF84846.1 uncharacterized protein Dvir_GJ25844 [Drosophila virilis]